jgi:hypothetical protein
VYAIKNGNKYVSLPGSERSYTTDVSRAQTFTSKEAAEANACSNERVIPLRLVWGE